MESVRQASFDDLGTSLRTVTFVVVDLETNGLPSHDAGITEIGAVKVRGGEVLAEFQTLVNPGTEIPPFISLLTGINNDMVRDAPEIGSALPAFLDWAGECVLVAHNAGFDIGFLKAGCQKIGALWPGHQVVDTLGLARAVLLRDEVPNRKLSTLAAHFGSPDQPVHRALADARATVHVLHGLFERLGSVGVTTLEDLLEVGVQMNANRRKKREIALGLPSAPGVYMFKDDANRLLYVGKSNNIRKRALTYFTRSEERDRMGRMVDLAASVGSIECATELEASVRELRLLLEHKPAFNRASTRTERNVWLRLTKEEYPRLSAVRSVRPDLGILHIGPVRNMEQASLAIDAITSVIGLRTCNLKLRSTKASPSCALAELGRCSAPCELRLTPAEYSEMTAAFEAACNGSPIIETGLRAKLAELAAAERYEEAAVVRDRLAAWLDVSAAHHRTAPLSAIAEVVLAAPQGGGWDVHVIRYGALANAGFAESEAAVESVARVLKMTAQTMPPPAAPAPANSMAEARMLMSWVARNPVRVLDCSDVWTSRWPNPLSAADELAAIQDSRQVATLFGARKFVQYTAPK